MIINQFPPRGIQQYDFSFGKLLSDSQNYPVWSFRTYGKLNYDLMRAVYAVRDPLCYWAAANNTKVWAIWDFSETAAPDAVSRKQLAELSESADKIEGFFNVVILVKNPLLRGVVTAVKWMMGEKVPVDLASDMASAIALGRRRYEQAGLDIPSIPDTYQLPDWNDALTTKLATSDIWWTLENRGKHLVDQAMKSRR